MSLLAVVAFRCVGAPLELEGYMLASGEGRFVLSEPESKRRSAWIEVGDSFAGYTLARFEAGKECLVLRKGDETMELFLKSAHVRPGSAATGTRSYDPAGRYAVAMDRLAGARGKADRVHFLAGAAKESFNAGKFEQAEQFARELLELAPHYPGDFAYGRSIHDANLVLGRLALREGDTDKAVAYLLTSARDGLSLPGTSAFGPNVSLAKDLLEQGQRESVLQYLDLCGKFWKQGRRQLDEWTTAIKAGTMPRFGGNLVY